MFRTTDNIRKKFNRIEPVMVMPNLFEVQLKSYNDFLQKDLLFDMRKNIGLQAVFSQIFPIQDVHNNFSLEFLGYYLGNPKYTVEECRERDVSYAAPLKAKLRLVIRESGSDGEKHIKDIIEQDVYMRELPLMTAGASFVINGAERVIVSQLHRSPGVFFSESFHPNGKRLYSTRVIPYRGSWLEFKIDVRDVIYAYIDKKRKLPATTLLRALGYSTDEEIIELFKEIESVSFEVAWETKRRRKSKRGRKKKRLVSPLIGRIIAEDVLDPDTEEVLLVVGHTVELTDIENFIKEGILELKETKSKKKKDDSDEEAEDISPIPTTAERIGTVKVISISSARCLDIVKNTLSRDKSANKGEALTKLYSLLKPGDPPSVETAQTMLEKLFFNEKRYNLAGVGRYKINARLGLDRTKLDQNTLTKEDFILILKTLLKLAIGEGDTDDIDHLGNRRIRSIGELLANQFSIGLSRMSRIIRERMSLHDVDTITPYDLVNARTVSAVINAFFGSSQLSQFMDQTNPLSELTHKRRLSALGPGGLTRERAGFEVRDVHHTHYGRMCPIETPEGPNIGLITSLSTYARVNKYGFLETPYRKVINGHATDQVEYLTADLEDEYTLIQGNVLLDKDYNIIDEIVLARQKGDFVELSRNEVEYMDVSTTQVVSIAAALIPFLEHDDANRALMGSNMQRQAVPLLNTEVPLIGTGVESRAAIDSLSVIVAKKSGLVVDVSSDFICIASVNSETGLLSTDYESFDRYPMIKFSGSNQGTCINQRPLVTEGEWIEAGEVIADGVAARNGELALGINALVAFMPWGGYNFEDAILMSEKLLKEDRLSSIHIEEMEVQVRDTKRGAEEITREIPNVSEEALRNLDENGLVCIGSHVREDDILVGKVTPKGETQQTPEERLLRAIFGDKAGDVRDASLKAPPGMEGVVIDVKVFSRRDKSMRAMNEIEEKTHIILRRGQKEIRVVRNIRDNLIKKYALGEILLSQYDKHIGTSTLKGGEKITEEFWKEHLNGKLDDFDLDFAGGLVEDSDANEKIREIMHTTINSITQIRERMEITIQELDREDELPPGVVQLVKVYIAKKRKISVGDKMAGRHGNKGVVARILPEEDMPYLPDGTPIEIVLNPLGVPSRMNVGQVLETHLGWAARELGNKLAIEKEHILKIREKIASEEEIEQWGDEIACIERIKEWLKIIYENRIEEIIDLENANVDDLLSLCDLLKDGVPMATPVFDGATYPQIQDLLKSAGLATNGQSILYDGRTGEPFDEEITIGYMYMLKLLHLVDDKVHARSIGPYSLVTQQPLGGKAQFGGQRFGEMEVWALEAYGAAYTLREMLTVKSDDVVGRSKIYEAIIKGENPSEPGIPESFNVLIKELQSLCLDIDLME